LKNMKKEASNQKAPAAFLLATSEPSQVAISDLTPDGRNANKGTKKGAKLIQESLRAYGAGRSVLIDKNGAIIAGNKTVENAKAIGLKDVIVVPSDGTKLIAVQRTDLAIDDPGARELAIADNRASELSLEWDHSVLESLDGEVDLSKFWSDTEELLGTKPGSGRGGGDAAGSAIVDKAAELKEKWNTKPAQIWEIPSLNTPGASHRICCGDSTEYPHVEALFGPRIAKLVNTDPPYGVEYHSDKTGAIANDAKKRDGLSQMLQGALKLAAQFSDPDAGFYIWHAPSTRRDFEHALDVVGLEEKQYIVWAKDTFVLGRADYHWQSEPCFYAQKAGRSAAFYGDRKQSTVWRIAHGQDNGTSYALANGLILTDGAGGELVLSGAAPKAKKLRTIRAGEGTPILILGDSGQTDTWTVTRDKAAMLHPNQKPNELAARAIRNSTQVGDWVYDPFGGSGFTMLAAEQEGRVALTMELDPKFVAVQLERMTAAGLLPKQVS
jgi:DNA modification methylase